MRIELTQDGGLTAAIPGLQKPPITLDSDDLSEEEAADLARQVEAAGFFELPARPARRPAARPPTVISPSPSGTGARSTRFRSISSRPNSRFRRSGGRSRACGGAGPGG